MNGALGIDGQLNERLAEHLAEAASCVAGRHPRGDALEHFVFTHGPSIRRRSARSTRRQPGVQQRAEGD